MMTMMRYGSDLQTAYGAAPYGEAVLAGHLLPCLWSVAGLTLTGLFFALGFAAEIGQALSISG